jgi:hypothetical protein
VPRCAPASWSADAYDPVEDALDQEDGPDAVAHEEPAAAPATTAARADGGGDGGGRGGLAHGTAHVRSHRSERGEQRDPRDWREEQRGRDGGAGRLEWDLLRPTRADIHPDQRSAMPGREGAREDMRRAGDAQHGRERGAREHAARFRDDAPPALPGAPGLVQQQHRAFVAGVDGGLSWRERHVLDRHFSQFGRVVDVFTPKGKSMAFVTFETKQQLERALNVPHVASGCTLRVLRAETVLAFCRRSCSRAEGCASA